MDTRGARQQAFLASRGFELGPTPYLADVTVTAPQTLDLGNQRLCLLHLGKAESDDALVIHLPQEECVVAGDTVMTGSFPMFGQPVMNEGLMGTSDWLETLQGIERLQPAHVLPGHGPVAHEQELALLKRLERYFLEAVASRVAAACPCQRSSPTSKASSQSGSRLSRWCGGHHAMPSCGCIGGWCTIRLTNRGGSTTNLQPYRPATRYGCRQPVQRSPMSEPCRKLPGSAKRGATRAVPLRSPAARRLRPREPAAWVLLAECLVRGAASVASVLEKGDFFSEARQALQRALELEPQYLPAHLALGRFLVMTAYRNGGTPTPGMQHLRQVIESLPVPVHGPKAALLAQAYLYMGMGYRTMGDESQAMACFDTALTHLPTFQASAPGTSGITLSPEGYSHESRRFSHRASTADH